MIYSIVICFFIGWALASLLFQRKNEDHYFETSKSYRKETEVTRQRIEDSRMQAVIYIESKRLADEYNFIQKYKFGCLAWTPNIPIYNIYNYDDAKFKGQNIDALIREKFNELTGYEE